MDETKKLLPSLILFFFSIVSLVTAGTEAINRNAFVGQQSGANYGYSIASGDFNADGFSDLLVGAPLEYVNGSAAGKVYLYYGSTQKDTKVDVTIHGTEEYEYLGKSVSSAGDFNGDGFEDFIVGADGFNGNKGVAFIYFGGPYFDIYPDVRLEYSTASSFGTMVTKLGDVNGDGFDDVAVSDVSNVFVYFGNASKSADNYQIISGYGNKIAYGGDVNGDGFEDILVGYPKTTGQVALFLGGSSWDATADAYMRAPASNDQFATSLAGGVDVNGDGYCDVIVGAEDDGHNGTGAGAAYLYFGGPDMIHSNQTFGYAPSVSFYGDSAGTHLGHAVGFCPDFDGDGFGEALVGESHFWYSSKPNRAFVFKGGHTVKPAPYRILHGEEGLNGSYFASAFASGDFNNDGYDDIFVGEYGIDKVFRFHNKPTGTESIPDLIIENNDIYLFTFSIDANGDFNGDGYDDMIVGNYSGSGPLNIYFGGLNMDAREDISLDGNTFAHKYIRYVGDVNGDGFDDFVVTNDDHQSQLIYGTDQPEPQYLDLVGVGGAHYECINYGDFNGDGFSDFVLSTISSNADSFLVFYGGRYISGKADLRGGGSNSVTYDYTACLDINGDGFDDILQLHSYQSSIGIDVYLGSSDDVYWSDVINASDFGPYSDITRVKQIGDINNDGMGDFIIRLKPSDESTTYETYAIVYGQANGGNPYAFTMLPDYNFYPIDFGYSGDLTGDGIDNLVLFDSRQNSNVLTSVFDGNPLDLSKSLFSIEYLQENDYYYSHAVTGDLNGDGVNDFIFGNHYNKIYTFLSSPAHAAPRLTAVNDVPADQGGKVSVVWFKSAFDGGKVASYRIERSIAPAGNGFAWETIATVSAHQNNYYSYTARTLSDAIEGYTGNTYFRISALDGDGRMVSQSNIAYGHSVDNLAPAAVANLSGSGNAGNVHLSWKANSESDLKEYHIYRSPNAEADLDTLTLYASVTDTTFEDVAAPAEDSYYFVRAVDVHGNGGHSAQWLYSTTGIVNNSTLPEQFKLEQNYPNPFNPTTSISYVIAAQGLAPVHVQLIVYNALGQQVKQLVDAQQETGSYSVTFDASNLASGVYLYRLSTDHGFVQTKKMILVR